MPNREPEKVMKDNEFFPINELWPQPSEEAGTLAAKKGTTLDETEAATLATEPANYHKPEPIPDSSKKKKRLVQKMPGLFVGAVAVVMLSTAIPEAGISTILPDDLEEVIQEDVLNQPSEAPDEPPITSASMPTEAPLPSAFPENAEELVEWAFAPFGAAMEEAYGRPVTYGDLYGVENLSLRPVYYATEIEVSGTSTDIKTQEYRHFDSSFDTGAALTEEELQLLLSDITKFEYITYLYMDRMNLADISFLSSLSKLDWIRLTDNQISDITPLASLPALDTVELSNNLITDLTIPSKLQVRILTLDGNQITSTEALSMWMLESGKVHISMRNNQLTRLTGFEFAEGLEEIGLTFVGNQITDISGLAALANAKSVTNLNLSYNQISDISALEAIAPVFEGHLDLSYNQLSDITPLENYTGTITFKLSENQVQDISALRNMVNMEELDLAHNQITDISPLAGMTKLTYLDFRNNSVTDISALSEMTVLEELVAMENAIEDISPLKDMSVLNSLFLSDNAITDISVLANLTALTHVDLENNNITDYSAVEGRDFLFLKIDE